MVLLPYLARWWIMGTVILLNLANFAHWIAFPAIAKKAAAYYDVSGKDIFVQSCENQSNWRLMSGEELDLIPTVSYAAGVPTCLIATYLIESRGLKTGVSYWHWAMHQSTIINTICCSHPFYKEKESENTVKSLEIYKAQYGSFRQNWCFIGLTIRSMASNNV